METTRFFGYELPKPRLTLRPNPTSRPQVMRFFALCSAAGFVLLAGTVTPLIWQRVALGRQIAAGQATLSPEFRRSEDDLRQELHALQEQNRQIAADWQKIRSKLGSFQQVYQSLAADPRRVDYKRERFLVMRALQARAANSGATLPRYDADPQKNQLGLPLDVVSGDNPARKIVQLKSAGALMGSALDWGMKRIESVRLLDPIERGWPKGDSVEVFGVEFPVEIVAVGDAQSLARWILGASNAKDLDGGHAYFFIVRNMKAEKASPAEPDAVRATMVFSAVLIFKELQQLDVPQEKALKIYDT